MLICGFKGLLKSVNFIQSYSLIAGFMEIFPEFSNGGCPWWEIRRYT